MDKTPRILALDLAIKTGWADSDGGSGVVELGQPHPDVANGWRYERLDAWLANHILHGVRCVVYEKAHHRGGPPTRLANGLIATVEHHCAKQGIPCRGYHTATIKKHATGKGNAKKHEMHAAAKMRNPDRTFIDDNEVDALFLLDLALHDFEISVTAPNEADA